MGEDEGELEVGADLPARAKNRLVLLITEHRSPRTCLFGEGQPFERISFEQIPALAIARHGGPVEHSTNGLQVLSNHAVPDRLPADLSDSTIAPLPTALNERIPIPPAERHDLSFGAEVLLEKPRRMPIVLLAAWALPRCDLTRVVVKERLEREC
jgi:hypothetical protein